MDPAPFIRGCAFTGTERVPYPRADAADAARLPIDTWTQAQIPVGVRLELLGDAEEIDVAYETRAEDMGYRGDAAGRTFSLWRDGTFVDDEPAVLGEGVARLMMGKGRAIVYLPEAMKPFVLDLDPRHGSIGPAPPQPRWVAYGDSVTEGWIASQPALAWPAIAGREHGLDVCNLGYAGAARGEIASAEQIAGLTADVISVTHGTNCWTRVPHTVAMFRAGLAAFLDVIRQGHPENPIVVASPILRPDAEGTLNRLGATLADLRTAMEETVSDRADETMHLVGGRDLVDETQLGDGVHPNDDGHRALAASLGPLIAKLTG